MKKAIALMLALLLVGGLFACGNEAPAGTTAPATSVTALTVLAVMALASLAVATVVVSKKIRG